MSYFRSIWKPFLRFSPLWGIIFILFIGIPRFILVLQANASGNYNFTSIIFVIMWLLPFIFLQKDGRRLIGLRKPVAFRSLLYGFILGVLACLPVFLLGMLLYGESTSNWFVYISQSYRGGLPPDLTAERHIYFGIFALTSMIFSPIGEELMYRGLIHQCFEDRFGSRRASEIDSSAFALTHLAHFGILYSATGWTFKPIPALLWVVMMFFVSRLFFYSKQKSGSIWGAVLSHAGFNLAMTYFIFYFIL